MQISPPPDLSDLIRNTRKTRGLTLVQLSELSGVSRSMLSAIERNAVNPTFSVVWALTQALGIDLTSLEEGPAGETPIEHLHSYSTPQSRSADGKCTLYMLSPYRTSLPVEWHDLHLEPGGCLASAPHAPGTVEHLTCLEGRLTVVTGEHEIALREGDTLRYRADCPHSIANEGESPGRALLLVALPTGFGGASS